MNKMKMNSMQIGRMKYMREIRERKIKPKDFVPFICGVLITRTLTKASLSGYDFMPHLNLVFNNLMNSKAGFFVLYVTLGLYQKEEREVK